MADQAAAAGDDITLRDVVNHIHSVKHELKSEMEQMEQRLTVRIDGLEGKVDRLEGKVDRLEGKVDTLERRVGGNTAAINMLESDLTVTIRDMLGIRRHVGMAAGDEE